MRADKREFNRDKVISSLYVIESILLHVEVSRSYLLEA